MSDTIWSTRFWQAAGERSLRSFSQSLLSLILAEGSGLVEARWWAHASIAGMAAVVSLLMSIIGNSGTTPGPSFGNAEVLKNPPQSRL